MSVNINAQTASLSLHANSVSVTSGSIAVPAQSSAMALTAVSAGVAPGPLTVTAQRGSMVLTPLAGVVTRLDPVSLYEEIFFTVLDPPTVFSANGAITHTWDSQVEILH